MAYVAFVVGCNKNEPKPIMFANSFEKSLEKLSEFVGKNIIEYVPDWEVIDSDMYEPNEYMCGEGCSPMTLEGIELENQWSFIIQENKEKKLLKRVIKKTFGEALCPCYCCIYLIKSDTGCFDMVKLADIVSKVVV